MVHKSHWADLVLKVYPAEGEAETDIRQVRKFIRRFKRRFPTTSSGDIFDYRTASLQSGDCRRLGTQIWFEVRPDVFAGIEPHQLGRILTGLVGQRLKTSRFAALQLKHVDSDSTTGDIHGYITDKLVDLEVGVVEEENKGPKVTLRRTSRKKFNLLIQF